MGGKSLNFKCCQYLVELTLSAPSVLSEASTYPTSCNTTSWEDQVAMVWHFNSPPLF